MQRSCLGVGVLRFIITVLETSFQFCLLICQYNSLSSVCWLWEWFQLSETNMLNVMRIMCMSRSHFFVWINAQIISARLGLIFQEQQKFSVCLWKLCLLVLKLCKLLPGIPQYTISHKILGNNCISIIYQFLGFS